MSGNTKKKTEYTYVIAVIDASGSTKVVRQDGTIKLHQTRDLALNHEQEFVSELNDRLSETVRVGLFSKQPKYTESQKRDIRRMINTIHIRKVAIPLRTIL